MIRDLDGSFGSRYFLSIANVRRCFASWACAFKSSGLISCLDCTSELRGLDRLKGSKNFVKYGEERLIVCDCTLEEKTIFLVFTQNGCYGNQPRPFEVLIETEQ